MRLTTRLVGTVAGLLVAALLLTGGATFGALQDWRSRQVDDLLAVASGEITAGLAARPDVSLSRLVDPGGGLWRGLAERGDVPSFVALREPDGRVRDAVALGSAPDPAALPGPDPDGSPAAGPRVATVPGPPDADGDAEPWRVRVSAPLPDGTVLLVGQRTTASAELISRTLAVLVTTSVIVLVVLVAMAVLLVRRGLRPLAAMTDAATAIGSGDLDRRVDDTSPHTEVGRLGAALNAMLARLEEAFTDRARSQERLRRFVADASHELRTPLATVRGYAELFRRGADRRPDDLADAMHRIEAEATRMSGLVDELLLLARLDQGRPLESRPVDLGALAAEAVDAARAREPDRPWTLSVTGAPTVDGDADRLRQVLANLLGNVRAHTPAGAPARLGVHDRANEVLIEVDDDGPGIPADERELVFERFHQVRAATTPSGDGGPAGSGLGLAIVAAVAAAHGGTATAGGSGGTLTADGRGGTATVGEPGGTATVGEPGGTATVGEPGGTATAGGAGGTATAGGRTGPADAEYRGCRISVTLPRTR